MANVPVGEHLVRVLNSGGHTVGVGVLLGPQQIVTCAHVVNSALGQDPRAQDQPAEEITVEFAAGDGQSLRAQVQRWLPPPRAGAAGDDIAGLVLTSTELPTGATPARLIANQPRPGQPVDVFGYPGSPPRPHGAWVEATVRGAVGNGRLQLDSTTDTALRIQPGFSGSPVYDRDTGRVIGLLASAPAAASGERDSYAITTERLRLAWPEVLDPRNAHARRRATSGVGELTILHVSDPQYGHHHLFGGNGLIPADQAQDTLCQRLHDDLDTLAKDRELRPDLMVVTGDLAEWGLRSEFDQVVRFLTGLTEAVELPRRHVAIVPGNHDVNRRACEAYFLRQSADECDPVAPYWPKWEHFAAAFEQFYDGVDGVSFTPDEPWTLFEMPDLAVVVAGLNSTMAESHRDADHYGWVGERQLRWFAERLAGHRDRGWLRLGAVHHNAVRGAVANDENLRDADDLDHYLGQPELVNLLLHGHTHDGRLHRLSSGLLVLSTGSAAVTPEARPQEVPNQYQLLTVRPSGVTRHARQYAAGQRRWIGDTRVSPTGSDWHHHEPHPLRHVHTTFTSDQPDADQRRDADRTPDSRRDGSAPGDGFFDRVLEATQASHPGATVIPRPEADYLRVSELLPNGGAEQWPVGVVDGKVTEEELTNFVQRVHRQFVSADPSVRSELVYSGPPAAEDTVLQARRHGVRLRSFVDYQGLIDLRPLVTRQAERLATDRRYPAELYVPQRYRLLGDDPDNPPDEDLLGRVIAWLGADTARFVMLLGDFGRGKTFLLCELARTLPQHLPGVLPVLVELRSLEKAPSLDELLAQHLVRQNIAELDVAKLRYMIRSGRLALLFDGFDELELRVGFDNAADYLTTLLRAVTDHAKIVLTSRTQHFRSTSQISTALGSQVTTIAASRLAVLEDFTEEQILQFLAKHYDGNLDAAQARFELLRDVHDLLGLSRNPRMLSFIANLAEERLRAIQVKHGQISAAELYRELVDFWLIHETERQRHPAGLPSLDPQQRLHACTALALRLWMTTARTIPETALAAEVSKTLTSLAGLEYTDEQAAHTVASRTLLIHSSGDFSFVHESVMEWLVANSAATQLQAGEYSDILVTRQMSPLMLDFLCDLGGHDLAHDWAVQTLADPAASEIAKQNGLTISQRLLSGRGRILNGFDLRSMDLTKSYLREASLKKADLRGMRLAGTYFANADLRGANLTGVRMVGGDLAGAQLAESRWHRGALLGVSGLDDLMDTPELAVAAISGRDLADVMIAPTRGVSCVAFSPDGTLIAVQRGHSVEIVDLASSQTLRVLNGHTGEVIAVAFSSDGALIATASWDDTARIWDATTGRHHTTLTGHTDPVTAVTFSPDSILIATASNDDTTQIWDPTTGRHHTTLTGHAHPVTAVAFALDGTLIATASEDRTARIWDPTTGHLRTVLQGHTHPVTAVAFSPDGTLIATASDDRTARIWDPTTGHLRTVLQGHTGEVTAVAFSPDGTLIATASEDETARIWDPTTGHLRTVLQGHTHPVTAVAFSLDGTLIATASEDETARIWDPTTGHHHNTLTCHTSPVTAVTFSPNGALIATASEDRTARIWDTTSGLHRFMLTGHTSGVTAVAFSPDGALIATASEDRTARIWDTTSGLHRFMLTGHTSGVTAVAFSPDGTLIATASNDDETAQVWDSATVLRRAVLKGHASGIGHTSGVTAVAFSPTGTLIATASWDHTAQVWDSTSGQHLFALTGHTSGLTAVAFSPDGTLIATASEDGTARICVYRYQPSRRVITLTGHTDWVTAVTFSPNGASIATASSDTTAQVWKTTTGQHRLTLTGHTSRVTAVAFSPDGTLIATASHDGTCRLWDATSGAWLASLLALDGGGHAVLLPDGSYKLVGDPGQSLWWAIKLCRFAPGELDPYDPTIRRLPADAPIPR